MEVSQDRRGITYMAKYARSQNLLISAVILKEKALEGWSVSKTYFDCFFQRFAVKQQLVMVML